MAKKSISRTTYRGRQRSPSKYGNQKTEVAGITFDSRKEAKRYQNLLKEEQTGVIRNLTLQPRFDLVVNGDKIATYVADFRYEQTETGEIVTEDVKSPATKTPLYRIKKKLMKALHNVDILEI